MNSTIGSLLSNLPPPNRRPPEPRNPRPPTPRVTRGHQTRSPSHGTLTTQIMASIRIIREKSTEHQQLPPLRASHLQTVKILALCSTSNPKPRSSLPVHLSAQTLGNQVLMDRTCSFFTYPPGLSRSCLRHSKLTGRLFLLGCRETRLDEAGDMGL